MDAVAIPRALSARRNPARVHFGLCPQTFGVKPMSSPSSPSISASSTIAVASLGTPRISPRRELKFRARKLLVRRDPNTKALIETRPPGFAPPTGRARKKLGVGGDPVATISRSTTRCSTPRVMVGAIPGNLSLERRPGPACDLFRDGPRRQATRMQAGCEPCPSRPRGRAACRRRR